jgi:hypothetical protein
VPPDPCGPTASCSSHPYRLLNSLRYDVEKISYIFSLCAKVRENRSFRKL